MRFNAHWMSAPLVTLIRKKTRQWGKTTPMVFTLRRNLNQSDRENPPNPSFTLVQGPKNKQKAPQAGALLLLFGSLTEFLVPPTLASVSLN